MKVYSSSYYYISIGIKYFYFVYIDPKGRLFVIGDRGVKDLFFSSWIKEKEVPPASAVKAVYGIVNRSVEERFNAYSRRLADTNIESFYHGTIITCSLRKTGVPCNNESCGACRIAREGFSPVRLGTTVDWFLRFGYGYYFAPNASKAHDFTIGHDGCRALVYCKVAQGRRHRAEYNMNDILRAPEGFDSVYGEPGYHKGVESTDGYTALNYPEVTVFDPDAILPLYIVLYSWEGIEKIIRSR